MSKHVFQISAENLRQYILHLHYLVFLPTFLFLFEFSQCTVKSFRNFQAILKQVSPKRELEEALVKVISHYSLFSSPNQKCLPEVKINLKIKEIPSPQIMRPCLFSIHFGTNVTYTSFNQLQPSRCYPCPFSKLC